MVSPREQILRAQQKVKIASAGGLVSEDTKREIARIDAQIQQHRENVAGGTQSRLLAGAFQSGQLTPEQARNLGYSEGQIAIARARQTGQGLTEATNLRQKELGERRAEAIQQSQQYEALSDEEKSKTEAPLITRLNLQERGQARAGELSTIGRTPIYDEENRIIGFSPTRAEEFSGVRRSVIEQQPEVLTFKKGERPTPSFDRAVYVQQFEKGRERVASKFSPSGLNYENPLIQLLYTGVTPSRKVSSQIDFKIKVPRSRESLRAEIINRAAYERDLKRRREAGLKALNVGLTGLSVYVGGGALVKGGISLVKFGISLFGKQSLKVAVTKVSQLITSKVVKETAKRTVKEIAKTSSQKLAEKSRSLFLPYAQAAAEGGATLFLVGQGVKATGRTFGQESITGYQESQELLVKTGLEKQKDIKSSFKPAQNVKELASNLANPLYYADTLNVLNQKVLNYGTYAVGIGGIAGGQQVGTFVSPSLKKEEEEAIRTIAKNRGIPESKIPEFIKNVRKAGTSLASIEAVGLIAGAERITERAGQNIFSTKFLQLEGVKVSRKEITRKLAQIGLPTFATLGSVEGVLTYETLLRTRGGERTVFGFLGSGLLGAGTSTLIGGTAFVTSATRKGVSKTASSVGQTLDFPQEFLGDRLSKEQSRVKRLLGFSTEEPALTPSFAKGVKSRQQEAAESFVFSVIRKEATKKQSRIPTRITTLETPFSVNQQNQQKNQETIQKRIEQTNKEISDKIASPIRGQGIEPSVQIEEITTKQEIPIKEEKTQKEPVKDETNIEQPIKEEITQKETATKTGTSVPIPISTNVFATKGFLPPLLPFPMSGTGGSQSKGNKIFINELAASQQLFKQQIGFGLKDLIGKKGKQKKAKKDKKEKNNQVVDRFNIANRLGFRLRNVFNTRK